MADPHHRAWLETRRGAWGEYCATPAGAVRAPAVVQCDSAGNRLYMCACNYLVRFPDGLTMEARRGSLFKVIPFDEQI